MVFKPAIVSVSVCKFPSHSVVPTMSSNKADPLLFSCNEVDTEFESLLQTADCDYPLSTSFNVSMNSFEPGTTDNIENWLQNSSMSQLSTAVDTEHNVSISEGHLLPVNPENVMPLQPAAHTPQKQEDVEMKDEDTVSNAAMTSIRLHANYSSTENANTVLQDGVPPEQRHVQHIQIVAIPVSATAGSGHEHTHVIPASLNQPPMKTIILDSNTGTFSVAGTTYFPTSPQKLQTVSSDVTPSQSAPVLVGHLQNRAASSTQRPITVTLGSPLKHTPIVPPSQTPCEPKHTVTRVHPSFVKQEARVYPKPVYSYSCLIALALKNSKTGNLPVNEIYNFMCENFPFFKTAPDGWKNSVRHNLSLNKTFAKVKNPKLSRGAKKGCLWTMNPAKVKKMDEEVTKWRKKDPANLLCSMAYPENLEAIENGLAGLPSDGDNESEEDENEPSTSPSVQAEFMSTPKKKAEAMTDEHVPSVLTNCELEQEYAAHALEWAVEGDVNDLHFDLVTGSPLVPSPITSQDSPQPCTPSRSAHNGTPPFLRCGSWCTSSPSHRSVTCSSATVRTNLFRATPSRKLSELN